MIEEVSFMDRPIESEETEEIETEYGVAETHKSKQQVTICQFLDNIGDDSLSEINKNRGN